MTNSIANASTEDLGKALGKIPSGVFILTVNSPSGPQGMMASWVQQSGFEPPVLAVAVHPDRAVYQSIAENRQFSLNQVSKESGSPLMRAFGRPSENPFADLKVQETASGPLLEDAMAFMACHVKEIVQAADHHVVIAEIVKGSILDESAEPFIHLRKSGFNY